MVRDIKESILRISEILFDEEYGRDSSQDRLTLVAGTYSNTDRRAHSNIPTVQYELPDGKILDIGPERFSIPEILFNRHTPTGPSLSLGCLGGLYLRANCPAMTHTTTTRIVQNWHTSNGL